MKLENGIPGAVVATVTNNPFVMAPIGANKATPPLVFEAEETEEAWLCTCKQTSTPPFCDGSHNG